MYKDIVDIVDSPLVKLSKEFEKLINKELCLGQTRYVCRYGTLSDGHDKITDAQRYYQAIREMYSLAQEMNLKKVLAMRAEADLMDAQDKLPQAAKGSEKLRVEADILDAQTRLNGALTQLKDQYRMLDEYNNVRQELEPIVRKQYPEGIEQAEPDNWKAVGEYWALKRQMGVYNAPLTPIPLEPTEKARLGVKTNMPELFAALLIKDQSKIINEHGSDAQKYLDKISKDTGMFLPKKGGHK